MSRIETERRWLVRTAPDLADFTPQVIMQGYFLNRDGFIVRVRRVSTPASEGAEYGSLTVKGPRNERGARAEEEMHFDDPALAGQLLLRCTRKLLKRRYALPDTCVVDVFDWANGGLVIAELEGGPDIYDAPVPGYAHREITGESAFNNEWLAYRPWQGWSRVEQTAWLGR